MKREQIIEILRQKLYIDEEYDTRKDKNQYWIEGIDECADAILALPLDVPSDEESQNHMIAMNFFQHKDEFGEDVWDEGKLHWAIKGYKIASKWMRDEIIKRNK